MADGHIDKSDLIRGAAGSNRMLTDWQELWWLGLSDAEQRAAIAALPALELRHHAVITPAQPGDIRRSVSVGPAGEVIASWLSPADLAALSPTTMERRPANARLAYMATRPVTLRVARYTPQPTITRITGQRMEYYAKALPLPQGRTLVIGAKSNWWKDTPSETAVYDDDGSVLAEGSLGDGWNHVLTTADGHIWVGYHDEGIVAGRLDDSRLGGSGLVRFTQDLRPDWQHWDRASEPSTPPIYDCYALNVDGDTVWTCYYSDFPIARIQAGVCTSWRNDVFGAHALAVGGDRVALCGGYGPADDRLVVGTLGDRRMHVNNEYRLVLPTGQPMPSNAQVFGRGPDLHVVTDTDWYRLGLDDIRSGWRSAKLGAKRSVPGKDGCT
ncbi:hypothetical protein ACLMAL_12265 [Nocardia sp. CWNU-33]|uniref:hypothetical protein n=1 Tax=Nocardia sp. CWNU-33 TaxID=3392117 RepID=UPI00398E468A